MQTIIALMLAAVQSPSPVPDWQPLGTAQDRFSLAWDAASVERGPEVVIVRLRTESLPSPETSPRAYSRVEIRCAAAMLRVVETVTINPDGSLARRDNVPQPFESIPPGSFVATIQRAVC